jgi:UDP-N-acetylglucosamine--N-acetylmuramyl-(pentapeptide) pyrophosphoryl-undecaprenol N-acetylglucosamine transferase
MTRVSPTDHADRRPIVLAAGGTGGHMFPAEALARTLLARGERVVLVTDRRGQAFDEKLPEVVTHRIRAATPSRGTLGRVRAAAELFAGFWQARRLLRRVRPAAVVGFGSYASVPTVIAAGRLGIPVALHEQNAVLGRANRLLAGRARVIATSFPARHGLKEADRAKAVATGMPVRPAIAAVSGSPYTPPRPGGPIELLITGGSQGAHVFAGLVPAALASLREELRTRLRVAQQCRPEDLEAVRAAYAGTGIEHELATFFTDVPHRLVRAHLVIARAGASTVAELAAVGRPAILVPYPFAMDDHQSANAGTLADADGAWLQPQATMTPQTLARMVECLLDAPDTLARAAAAAWAFGRGDAAGHLADVVQDLAGRPPAARPGEGRAPGPSPAHHLHREAAE